MCYDGGGETSGRQEAGPDSPSRRAFSRLLLAGTGLAALTACTPAQPNTPSGTPGPTPGPTPGTGSATQTAAATASSSPLPASTGGDRAGVRRQRRRRLPAVGRGRPSIGRGARAAAFTHGPHQPVGDRQQAPAALPRHLCAAGSGPAGRPPGHLRRGGAAEQHDGGRGGEDVRCRGRRRRRHYPGQRIPFVRDADGNLRQLREVPRARPRPTPPRPGRAIPSTRRAGRSTSATAAAPIPSCPSSRTGRRRSGPRPMPTVSASWSATRGCCTKSPGITTSPGTCASSARRRPRTWPPAASARSRNTSAWSRPGLPLGGAGRADFPHLCHHDAGTRRRNRPTRRRTRQRWGNPARRDAAAGTIPAG